MKRVRWSIIVLVVLLALLINVGRLHSEAVQGPFHFALFLSVLSLLEVLVAGRMPVLRRGFTLLLAALCVGMYLVCSYLIFGGLQHASPTGVDMAASLLEIAVLSGIVLVARDVANRLGDLEQIIIELAVSSEGRHVRRFEEAGESIQIELRRCLRYQRPLSVIVVEPQTDSLHAALPRAVEQAVQDLGNQIVRAKLGRTITGVVRQMDTVLEHSDGKRYVILCPETDRTSALVLMQRIQAAAEQGLGVSVACGEAPLPAYQVTFEELVRQAERELHPTAIPVEQVAARESEPAP